MKYYSLLKRKGTEKPSSWSKLWRHVFTVTVIQTSNSLLAECFFFNFTIL